MYSIFFDYGSEGYKLEDQKFDSIAEALDWAIKQNRCAPFIIAEIIDWTKSVEITKVLKRK